MARKAVLEEQGHRVVVSSSGADALDHCSREKIDLVVTDDKLRRMDGFDLLDRLRTQFPNLPVILISDFVDALGLNEENTGADAVIQKSANEVNHLIRAVSRLLHRKISKKPASQVLKAKGKAV
jgi:two-component system sensor histidine kinase/response regulator